MHGPVKHQGELSPGHRAQWSKILGLHCQSGRLGRRGGLIIPVPGRDVGKAGVSAGFQREQAAKDGKCLGTGDDLIGVQTAHVVALDDAPDIQLIGAQRSVVVFLTIPHRDAVWKLQRLTLYHHERALSVFGRDSGEEVPLLIVAAQSYRLPGIGIADHQVTVLDPTHLRPFRVWDADGHIPAVPLRA